MQIKVKQVHLPVVVGWWEMKTFRFIPTDVNRQRRLREKFRMCHMVKLFPSTPLSFSAFLPSFFPGILQLQFEYITVIWLTIQSRILSIAEINYI